MTFFRKKFRTVSVLAISAFVAAGCGGSGGAKNASKQIRIDGSSTVAPLSEAAAEKFQKDHSSVKVTVGTSGTGGGFEKFCMGEIDISDASREIKDEEIEACKKKGVEYEQLQVANDGIAVVVNSGNDWAKCLTVDQLKKVWDQGSTVSSWKDVDDAFPDEPIELFGPGTDSGTFDFFTDVINGEEGRSRTDYNATEDDNVTVQGVSGSKGGIGYFGLSYAEQNADKVSTVEIDGGDGCQEPTAATVQSGKYAPLSRPLFIYPATTLIKRAEGKEFLEFYAENALEIAEQALFVPLTNEQHEALIDQVEKIGA